MESYFYHFLKPVSEELTRILEELERAIYQSPRFMITHSRTLIEAIMEKVMIHEHLENIPDIIDELDLSVLLKSKIKGREDLGDDERYGRRVMFEFNKSYPIIMTPMLEKEQLKDVFLEFLGYYYDVSEIRQKINYSDLTTNEKHQSLYAVTTINRPHKSETVATDKSDYE